MQAIRAFVGHSFSDQDKGLVASFLEHFTNLTKAYPQFSWDHAEEAEPLPLSEKVLAKVEGKNVFIGICTKNERAVRDAALSATFFNTEILKAKQTDFQWKASDWIIQEIGLAVGRKMSVIVFLEDEVREPGGLHGNIEYIRFSRLNPHASFDKFLQMLVSLTPKQAVGTEAESKGSSQEEKAEVPAGIDWEPRPDWTKEKYDEAMVRMIFDENKDGLEAVSAAFRASRFAQGDAVGEWDARLEWMRLLFAKEADFEKLRRLAKDQPGNSSVNYYLGRGYDQLGEHENAAKAFEQAALAAADAKEKLSHEADAAIQYAVAGQPDLALRMFDTLKESVRNNPELQNFLFFDLRNLAQRIKDDALELAVLEQMVTLKPADVSLRFEVAYKHSAHDNKDMALYHYLRVPEQQRDATTWNNIGVSFSSFDMPVKGVSAYLRSESEGETLAMANIGYKLLNAGFLEEAKKRATKALQIDDYHGNINDLLKRLREVPDEENKKQAAVLEKVTEKAAFYKQLGKAVLSAGPTEVAERWNSPDGPLIASLDAMTVTFSGAEERDENPFANLLIGSGGLMPTKKVVHRTKITARIRGNMLVGEIKRSRDGEPRTIATDYLNIKTLVSMFFSADRSAIHVMESSGGPPTFYTLTRAT